MFRSRRIAPPASALRSFSRLIVLLAGCLAAEGCVHPWPWREPRPLFTIAAEHAIAPFGGNQYATSWSPDGTHLALMRNIDGNWDVWTIRLDGTDLRQLTHEPSRDDAASWSPDGRRLVFSSDRATRIWPSLWLIDLQQPQVPERLTQEDGKYFFPIWSPDGTQIAYIYLPTGPPYLELRTVSVPGRVVRVVSREGILFSPPTWSPDGKKIAFASDRTGNADIWILDLSMTDSDRFPSAALRQLTHDPAVDTQPSWSPDGRFIAFTSARSGHDEIWVTEVPQDPSQKPALQQLTRHSASNHYPRWSPDGKRIAFTSTRSGHQAPWLIELGP